jgi:hypothetical protein
MHCDTGAVCIAYSMYSIGTARSCFGEGILTYNVRYSYVRKDEMRKRQPQHHHHQHHHHHHTGCTSPAIATAVTTKEQQIQNPTVGKVP